MAIVKENLEKNSFDRKFDVENTGKVVKLGRSACSVSILFCICRMYWKYTSGVL